MRLPNVPVMIGGAHATSRQHLRALTPESPDRDDRRVNEHLDPREDARNRRRDRDAEAEARALLRPGMGKVFKQILDAQRKAAEEPPPPASPTPHKAAKRTRR
jgi:hypothetical protein